MEVVTIGNASTDFFSYCDRFPESGETVRGSKFRVACGGKGANSCVAAAKLGAKCAMITSIGDDKYSEDYITRFKELNINTDNVKRITGYSTEIAQIIVNEKGENVIVLIEGGAKLLNEEDLLKAEPMISMSKAAILDLQLSEDTVIAALEICKKHGVPSVLIPAPPREFKKEVYLCDYLILNETESSILANMPVRNVEDAKVALQHLLTRGCGTVIITLGENGLVFGKKDEEPNYIPAKKVIPVDTTGAGDAFVGSFTYFLAKRPDIGLIEKVKRASAYATISVQYPGTQESYPWRNDLPEELLF